MNFYEELGVVRSASTEEVRQAYKSLARLVHPDQCADPKLRGLAEIQMRRLNELLAVLTDPEQRGKYDAGLDRESAALRVPSPDAVAAPKRWTQPWLRIRGSPGAWVWLAASALAVAAFVAFFARDTEPLPQPPSRASAEHGERRPAQDKAPPEAAAQQRERTSAPLTQGLRATRGHVRHPGPERQRGLTPPPLEARASDPASAAAPARPQPAAAAVEVEPPPVSGSGQAAGQPAPPPAPPGFAGNWFYAPGTRQPKAAGLYPPVYIQLRLTEDAGRLTGRFRARYVVTDQAISPDVAFEFTGPGGAPSARLSWTAPGGASGEIVLRLLSERELRVDWKAYRLGGDISLTAGTGALVRQQDQD